MISRQNLLCPGAAALALLGIASVLPATPWYGPLLRQKPSATKPAAPKTVLNSTPRHPAVRLLASTLRTASLHAAATRSKETPRTNGRFGELPLVFEKNQGQADPRANFLARGSGFTLLLSPTDALLSLSPVKKPAVHSAIAHPVTPKRADWLRMRLIGSNAHAQMAAESPTGGQSSYFIGNNPSHWHTNIPQFGKVRFGSIYPGVDVVYYGRGRQLEHDFIISPGSSPHSIAVSLQSSASPAVKDKSGLKLQEDGSLQIATGSGAVKLLKPEIYQEVNGSRRSVEGGYVLRNQNTVGFRVAAYDHRLPLVIDPVFFYAGYLGGSNDDSAAGIAVDSTGSAYITGYTTSTDFPVTNNAIQPALVTTPGDPFTTPPTAATPTEDAFVTKLDPDGATILYSTFLGGDGNDRGAAIAVDTSGSAYVTGTTSSFNFPTSGSFGFNTAGGNQSFVAKLDSTGSFLTYSGYLGSQTSSIGSTQATGIAVDSSGSAYVVGSTSSSTLATTGAFQRTYAGNIDGFVAKLYAGGGGIQNLSYLGGTGEDHATAVAVDTTGNAYVTGWTTSTDFPTTTLAFQTTLHSPGNSPAGGLNGFITKLNFGVGQPTPTIVYSTYLGGTCQDFPLGIGVDSQNRVFVTGQTCSPPDADGFPASGTSLKAMPSGPFDAFVTCLNPSGTALVYSTYLGGSGYDDGRGIAVDNFGNAFVTGQTTSPDFPVTPGAVQPTLRTMADPNTRAISGSDAYMTALDQTGHLIYSTYLGGSDVDAGNAIAGDNAGRVYIAGYTRSLDFPITNMLSTTTGATTGGVTRAATETATFPRGTFATTSAGRNTRVMAGAGTTYTVSGSLVDQNGQPETGFQANISPAAFTSRSSSGNTFIFNGLRAGTYQITFTAFNIVGSQTISVTVPGPGGDVILPPTTVTTNGMSNQNFQVTGAVVDQNGAPVTNYELTVAPGQYVSPFFSNGNLFKLFMPTGSYTLIFSGAGVVGATTVSVTLPNGTSGDGSLNLGNVAVRTLSQTTGGTTGTTTAGTTTAGTTGTTTAGTTGTTTGTTTAGTTTGSGTQAYTVTGNVVDQNGNPVTIRSLGLSPQNNGTLPMTVKINFAGSTFTISNLPTGTYTFSVNNAMPAILSAVSITVPGANGNVDLGSITVSTQTQMTGTTGTTGATSATTGTTGTTAGTTGTTTATTGTTGATTGTTAGTTGTTGATSGTTAGTTGTTGTTAGAAGTTSATGATGTTGGANPLNAFVSKIDIPPLTPGVTAMAVLTTQINLNLTNSTTFATGISIERRTGSGPYPAMPLAIVPPNTTLFADTALAPNASYAYRVRAIGADGIFSAYSPEVTAITGSTTTTLPPTPLALSGVAVSPTQINLSFVPGPGGVPAAFRIFRVNGFSPRFVPVTLPVGQVGGTATTFSDTSVAPGTTYTYEVVATSSMGDSIPSAPFVVTSLPPAPILTAAAISQTQIALTLNTGGVPITGFKFERASNGAVFLSITPAAGSTSTTFIDNGLMVGTTYTYRVRESNSSGDSALSNTVTLSTLTDSISGVVTAFATSTPTPLVGVIIQLVNSLGNPIAQTATNATGSYTFTGLADGSYTVKLLAPGQTAAVTAAVNTSSSVNNGATTANLMASPLNTFPIGLSMISLPYDYTALGTDAATIIGTTNIATYMPADPSNPNNPLGNTYLLYPQLPGPRGNQILPGKGYFIGENALQPLLTGGSPLGAQFSTTLLPGWNMIGDPYPATIDLNKLFFSLPVPVGTFPANSQIPFTAANTNNVVRPPLYTFAPPASAGASGSYVPAASINPFVGYWIYIDPTVSHNSAVTLTFTNPGL